MYPPGSRLRYRSISGTVCTILVDIVPDVDRTYYALRVTSPRHPQHPYGTELLVLVGSDRLTERKPQ